jgi:AbiV family abortive infection protein
MAKKNPYLFTDGELRNGCSRCIENVMGLLNGAKMLLEDRRLEVFALGLYIYAVEEYGKAILLKKSITPGKTKHQIDGWILGHGNPTNPNDPSDKTTSHDAKIKLGFDNLPVVCRSIFRGVTIYKAGLSNRTIFVKKDKKGQIGGSVSVQKGTTGKFIDTTNLYSLDNLDLKTACFYIDWDIKNKNWNYELATDREQLRRNIKTFENALPNFKC